MTISIAQPMTCQMEIGKHQNFLGFESILVIFWVLGVFWSFFGFRGYFDHFLGFGDILIIFRFQGILVIFEDFRVLWSFSL